LTGPAGGPAASVAGRAGSLGWLEYLALAVIVFAAAYASTLFGTTAGRIAAVWPVNAMVIAWGFRSRSPRHFILAAGYTGNLFANLAAGDHSLFAILLPLANTLEIWVCLTLLDGRRGRFDMARPDHLAGFAFIIAPLGAAASTLLAALIFATGGAPPGLEALTRWFLADLLGLIVVTPALLALVLTDLRADLTADRIYRGLFTVVLLCGTLFAIFSQNRMPLLFLAPPVLVLLAFELGFVGASLGVLLTTVASVAALLAGSGPLILYQADMTQQVLLMQLFLATCILSCMPVAAILTQRSRLMQSVQAEKDTLSASEARYRHLWEKSSDIILRIDPTGRLLYASPSISTFGYSAEELMSRPVIDFIAPESQSSAIDIFTDALSAVGPNPGIRREHLVVTKSGDTVWLEGSPYQLRDSDGKLIEVVTVLRDITARRATEERLAAAKESAEAAASAKANFLSNMSHELRTPLTSIIGFAGLLEVRKSLADEDRRTVGIVKVAGETLLSMVNDILDYSKLEAGGVILEPTSFSLSGVLRECIDLVRVQADAKGLSLTHEMPEDVAVFADRGRLRQIMLNLLGNAVKFTSSGRVALVAHAITDATHLEITIAVTDTGSGIAPDKLNTIFERFSQADGSVSRRFGGTGLGLSISRSLAQMMGGTIMAQSDGRSGSTFTLKLRLEGAPPFLEADPPAVTGLARAESGR
jgi:PAS domain S-box-containing protein